MGTSSWAPLFNLESTEALGHNSHRWRLLLAHPPFSSHSLGFVFVSPEIMQHQGAQNWEQRECLFCCTYPCPQARPQGNTQSNAVLGGHSWDAHGAGPPEQAEQGSPFFLQKEWQRRSWGWDIGRLSSCVHAVPPHRPQHVRPW